MKPPRVSVCLPNLNNRRFLPDRIDSILAQSFTDWELVIVDGFSDDGAWEYLVERAAREPRIRLEQAPREGIYAGINRAIAAARGDFVYIATSDDTMAPDCLEQLVQALERHPSCDLAHCELRFIDEAGRPMPSTQSWWAERSVFARSSGPARTRRHIRHAPFDGLLALYGQTIYLSLTQLLIRRSLFDRIGLFDSCWGSTGDFNWAMRATLVASTVHVPDTWASWRLHAAQATAAARLESPEHARRVAAMIADALQRSAPALPPPVRAGLDGRWRREADDIRLFVAAKRTPGEGARRGFLLRRLLAGSPAARKYLRARLAGRERARAWDVDTVRRWLRTAGIEPITLVPS